MSEIKKVGKLEGKRNTFLAFLISYLLNFSSPHLRASKVDFNRINR